MTAHAKTKALKPWQVVTVTCLIIVIALGLAVYAAAASYESVSREAAAHNVPLPRLNPLGLDGGLFGVIVLNVALTWMRQPLGWLRLTARLFAAGTITANAAAGWPDPVGVGLRIAAPLLFVVLAEVASAILLRRHRGEGGEEGVPLARWLLAPRPTFVLWRRMKLWRIRDYRVAVDMELSRLQAIEKLTGFYPGKDWRQAVPGDLAWMLRNGVRMEEALARVAELTKPAGPVVPPAVTARQRPAATARKRTSATARKRSAAKGGTTALSPEAAGMDLDTEALVLKYIGEGKSASEAGILAGVTDGRGRQIARLARAKKEPAGGERTDGDMATGEQPRVS